MHMPTVDIQCIIYTPSPQTYGAPDAHVQHTLLPLPRSAPVVVLDYDDWNPQCTWPDEDALGVITMGSERLDESAPSLPHFRGSAGGSVHGGLVGSRQRITQMRPTEMQLAAASDAPEAAALLLQLAEALRGLAAHGDMSAHGGGRRGAGGGKIGLYLSGGSLKVLI